MCLSEAEDYPVDKTVKWTLVHITPTASMGICAILFMEKQSWATGMVRHASIVGNVIEYCAIIACTVTIGHMFSNVYGLPYSVCSWVTRIVLHNMYWLRVKFLLSLSGSC